MRQNSKRLLAALILMTATQTSPLAQAEGIRLVGPSGEVQSSPIYAEPIERAQPDRDSVQPSRFYGPTKANETLWSVASQLRPSRAVSVQQTLFAIYRINPQAFEQQNIHGLIPGSQLRVPSIEQIRSATTAQAIAVMKAHEAKLTPAVPVKVPAPEIKSKAKPESALQSAKPAPAKPVVDAVKPAPVPALDTSPEGQKQVSELKDKLQISQGELESLEEKNHRLRLMLSEVQSEVETLKTELNDEDRIRSEVEKLLEAERQRLAEQQRMQPSLLDQILGNGWLVALTALIPGVLIALLIVVLLGRRSNSAKEDAAEEAAQVAPVVAESAELTAPTDELLDDLSLDDDLFADDSETDGQQENAEEQEEDIFADLDSDDLDFNLEGELDEDPFASIGDDGDLDVGFDEFDTSASSISVNGDEKALGLEEMERALDEVTPQLEVLDEAGDEDGFDLSDDEPSQDGHSMSDEEFAELLSADEPTEELPSGDLDQSILDELLSGMGEDDLELDVTESANNETISDSAFSAGVASDDDIDKLLAQYDQNGDDDSSNVIPDEPVPYIQPHSDASDTSTVVAEQVADTESDPLAELEQLSGLAEEVVLEDDSTELLDELLDFDDEAEVEDFDPLTELEQLSGVDDVAVELDENSTDLLDDWIESESEMATSAGDESDGEWDPFDDLIQEEETTNQSSDENLLASLGFADSSASESVSEVEQPAGVVAEEDETLAGELDIDSLLADNAPVEAPVSTHSDQAEPEKAFDSHSFIGDLEDSAPKHDPLLNEPDTLSEFQSESADGNGGEAELGVDDDAGLQALAGQELSSTQDEVPDISPDEVSPEPENTPQPKATPTPNTLANEFGVPQEEDWLLDGDDQDIVADDLTLAEVEVDLEPVAADDSELSFDELELPEFGEQDAAAVMADEPALADTNPEPVAADDSELSFDELELPEFGEQDAAAAMADEPALADTNPEPVAADASELSFDELELPEFGEQDAAAAMAGEPALADTNPEPVAADASELSFDELELPEFGEQDAVAAMADEPVLADTNPEPVAADASELSFDELELPEFGEQDAAAAMAGEPALAEITAAPVAADDSELSFDELELPEFGEQDAAAAMADEPALADITPEPVAADDSELSFDELELPEFGEQDAAAAMAGEPTPEGLDFDGRETDSDTITAQEPASKQGVEPHADPEQDALFDMFAQQGEFQVGAEPQTAAEPALDGIDEATMASLLSEETGNDIINEKPDSEASDSAGLDFDAMLDVGEDWNGFKLQPEQAAQISAEVPEDQREVWSSSEALTQPDISAEDWADQQELEDFDPKKSQFMTIDELMAQVDRDGGEFEEQALMLDVGLNEFPDVIGDNGDVDVDNNAEAAGKLDLAKIYLEMNDNSGAVKLLEEAIVDGDDDIRREAKALIDEINGR
ncbi:FimV/HubP family polar landmark protein [Vibrio sp. CAU 1672]|uniref:FimV/HubP family polar landmark protein n=1 Tax=Vibrio sp. CAU 1672 TaxID=3032594 RepID=UPI0023D9E846|nr:FimV/HubP family polar landmark protein [Vibrio sp. CAU 1672]MDF2153786.1 AAA family ATPase [Vibrio sp. CAU 1672]